jgi:hypothetical protein
MTLSDEFLSACMKETFEVKAPANTAILVLAMFDKREKVKKLHRKWTLVALWSTLPITALSIYFITLFTDFDLFYLIRKAFAENFFHTILDIVILSLTVVTIVAVLSRLFRMRLLVLGR